MTRIVAGGLGGRRLLVPQGPTRPTSERVREALFDALEAANSLDGAQVLDLYSGSGALGLEALSRGARAALLVDSDRRAAHAIRRNIETLGVSGALVRQAYVHTVLRERPHDSARDLAPHYDLVLADPPYAIRPSDLTCTLRLLATGWLAEGATVVVELAASRGSLAWPDAFLPVREKRYGDSALHWARAARPG